MIIKDLLTTIDYHVPFSSAEEWDNVGLIIGDQETEITGILTALDCTNEIIEQAVSKNYNTIICHHPLIFKGVKTITNDGYGKLIRKIIQNNIQVIVLHTNLDHYQFGVNAMLANKLKLHNTQILNPITEIYYKVQTFIPNEHVDNFKSHLNEAGLAKEGNYEYCFFESSGKGQFKPVGEAHPYLGTVDQIEYVNEVKLEFMIKQNERETTESIIQQYHPYETPVYDFIELKRATQMGLGMIGELDSNQLVENFVADVKQSLDIPSVRYAGDVNQNIKTVAIIGGAGIGYEELAFAKGADIFVTGDVKHHDALDAKTNGINILDINHYSEYVMKEGLRDLLNVWLDNDTSLFPIEASTINTDPFKYF